MALPRVTAFALITAAVGLAIPAGADDAIPGHAIDRSTDGLVIAGALGVAAGLSLVPVSTARALWNRELFGDTDAAVHARFSLRAARISDALVGATIAAPLGYLTGPTIDDADGDRFVLYAEALAINLALFQGVKHLVQRPRPYLYSQLPEVQRYAVAQGKDAYQSFYSAHAATAFCAATAGAYLAGAGSTSRGARAAAWAGGFAAAAAASNLRVRAGKHFYSDIVIGGIVGIAIGYAVPALHADGRSYVPSSTDLGAAAAGLLGGGLVSQLLALERLRHDGPSRLTWLRRANLRLGPIAMSRGAGVGVAGALR
jgi:membrane-associated phospholipid phosphatase